MRRVRGIFTLIGVAAAGFLLWLSTQFGGGDTEDYWIAVGLVAAAGLALVLSQLFGGWTKWGWPRVSGDVFVLGFLPALLLGGWVLLSGQPDDNWFQRHVVDWSGDLHISRLVRHLREGYLGVIAFGIGAVFGFTFDTTGPRVRRPVAAPPAAPPPLPPPSAREETAVTTVAGPAAPADAAETRVVARETEPVVEHQAETSVLEPRDEPPSGGAERPRA